MIAVGQELDEEPYDGSDINVDYTNQRRYYGNDKPQKVKRI